MVAKLCSIRRARTDVMKNIFIFILIFSLPIFAISNVSFAESNNKNTKTQSKKKTLKKKKKIASKKKSRSIASVKNVEEEIASLEAQPKKNQKNYFELADLYLKQKKYDKAIESLKLANKPQSLEALDKLSKVYNEKGDTEEEIRALELVRVEGRASPNQLTRLGLAYVKLKKTESAIAAFRESISKAPKYEKAYAGLFEMYKSLNNFYDARLIIIEVMEKFGDLKYWLNEFCKIEIEQNYFENAKQICQKAISKDPKNPDNHVYLALSYQNTENPDQARKILLKAASQFKKSEVTQWNAGQMSCSIKNWEQAADQFKQCTKVDPESGRCFLGLGKTQYELKKYEEALDSMMKACPFIKGVDVEIRRLSYDLEKVNEKAVAKKYMSSTDKCTSSWFSYTKKNKSTQSYKRNLDKCFMP